MTPVPGMRMVAKDIQNAPYSVKTGNEQAEKKLIQDRHMDMMKEQSLTRRTECVAVWKCPHASEELSETTSEDGHANDDIGLGDTACPDVVEREEECRGRKREHTTEMARKPVNIRGKEWLERRTAELDC